MSRPSVDGLRSIDLGVPDLAACERFYTDVWQLSPVARGRASIYFRGTGAYHHLLGLHAWAKPSLLQLNLTAPDKASVDALYSNLRQTGLAIPAAPGAISDAGGGYGFFFRDDEGRTVRIVSGDFRHSDVDVLPDRPIKITHVVLNSRDVARATEFYCGHLGFRVIDRTARMTFLCCNDDHHSLAFAHSDRSTLHHIAFEVKDIDSVMRGAGRMRDNGFNVEWGIGRHGPGDNVFAYFVGPDDVVIEYTAEVQKVDETYRVRGPADWTWPPGRTDQWGIAIGPTDRLKSAQEKIHFANEEFRPELLPVSTSD